MKKIWRLLDPILIYYLIACIVDVVSLFILGEELSEGDTLALTMATAAAALPVFIYLYRRDRAKRGGNALPDGGKSREVCARLCKNAFFWVFTIVGSVALCITWNQLIAFSGISTLFPAGQEVVESLYAPPIAVVVLGTGILVPAVEEVLFRGLVYGRMRDMAGSGISAAVSALVFGAFHGNILQGIYAAGCGLVFALLYEASGSVLAPIVSHCAMNLMSVALTESRLLSWETISTLPVSVGIALVAILSFAAIVRLYKR